MTEKWISLKQVRKRKCLKLDIRVCRFVSALQRRSSRETSPLTFSSQRCFKTQSWFQMVITSVNIASGKTSWFLLEDVLLYLSEPADVFQTNFFLLLVKFYNIIWIHRHSMILINHIRLIKKNYCDFNSKKLWKCYSKNLLNG